MWIFSKWPQKALIQFKSTKFYSTVVPKFIQSIKIETDPSVWIHKRDVLLSMIDSIGVDALSQEERKIVEDLKNNDMQMKMDEEK